MVMKPPAEAASWNMNRVKFHEDVMLSSSESLGRWPKGEKQGAKVKPLAKPHEHEDLFMVIRGTICGNLR